VDTFLAVYHGVGAAPLEPVHAGAGKRQRREELVEIGNRASADQRQGTMKPSAQAIEQLKEVHGNPHSVRVRSDRQEGAVNVEEKSMGIRRRGHFGSSHQ
jgi:hypothetical protein